MGPFFITTSSHRKLKNNIICGMNNLLDVNKDDLLPSLGKSKGNKRKSKKIVLAIIEAIVFFLFAITISISAQLTYDLTRYAKFYVNGESMYPTFNRNTEVYFNGERVYSEKKYLLGDFSLKNHKYLCDYGLMDSKEGFISTINRFSIVLTYYNSEMEEVDGFYHPINNAELKIKRVIALPGEEIYFDSLGDLYIKEKGKDFFELINQPFLEMPSWDVDSEDFFLKAKMETNLDSNFANEKTNSYKLGDDEYFLVGDNRIRGCSIDSRKVGAIKSYAFVGKAITIFGKCWYSIDEEGNSSETIDLGSLIMPWELKIL